MFEVLVFASIILGLMLAAIRLSRKKLPPVVEAHKVWVLQDGEWVELKGIQSVTWHSKENSDD